MDSLASRDFDHVLAKEANLLSRVLSQCDPAADEIDLSLLEHITPIEWDNVVLYRQYILDRKLVRSAAP